MGIFKVFSGIFGAIIALGKNIIYILIFIFIVVLAIIVLTLFKKVKLKMTHSLEKQNIKQTSKLKKLQQKLGVNQISSVNTENETQIEQKEILRKMDLFSKD